jgi:uncharacterized protein
MHAGHADGGLRAATDSPIERALDRARRILPDQGPIGVFIHHNTLHAFQHLAFHEAVPKGAELLGARPYLPLDTFERLFRAGRIGESDLAGALDRALGDDGHARLAVGLTRTALWRALMQDGIDEDDAGGVRFLCDQSGDPDAVQLSAEARLARTPRLADTPPRLWRHRDALCRLGARDVDDVVHAELIRLSSAFLDHGQALQGMPARERGFLGAAAQLVVLGAPEPTGCPGVANDLRAVARHGRGWREVLEETLAALGVPDDAVEEFLLHTALALPGWTGMFARLETHPEEHAGGGPVSLGEFLAVRLLHERRAIEQAARDASLPVAWAELVARAGRAAPRPAILDAWLLAGIARAAGLPADAVGQLSDDALAECWREVARASRLARQRVWQEAYEGHYREQVLDALARLRQARHDRAESEPTARPEAQFVFCIDEREESIRRAIDEQPGRLETFGVAGFFGMAIDYQGLDDPKPAAYCPVVVTPQHEVHEAAVYTDRRWHLTRAGWRARWQAAGRMVHRESRTLSGGAGLSLVLGPFAAITALARVLAPRRSLAWRDRVRDAVVPRPATRLSPIREDGHGQTTRGKHLGFGLDEAADRVTALLRNIGMVRDFAPIVIVLGHGSTSLNNPHESAHDCGACGGRRGEANARLFAEMANRPEVRAAVRARGVTIPADTWFVGALHDTANDAVSYADMERLPATHVLHFERAHAVLDRARAEAAAERVRRFDDAPLGLAPDVALRHVETRATHLAQPRPEYGHCTNASAVVGRRTLTRGLHLDRRAFLISYDPSIDPDHTILERILAAVGPVGAGINLEYYFSSVDNERFGCGTKLPHNVTGLIGVMAGHQSDLRTGLPLQMVEIHEPMRLLLIVEATPATLLEIAGRQAEVRELVVNEWVQLVSVDPESGAMLVFEGGAFVPYVPLHGALHHGRAHARGAALRGVARRHARARRAGARARRPSRPESRRRTGRRSREGNRCLSHCSDSPWSSRCWPRWPQPSPSAFSLSGAARGCPRSASRRSSAPAWWSRCWPRCSPPHKCWGCSARGRRARWTSGAGSRWGAMRFRWSCTSTCSPPASRSSRRR